MKTKTSKNDIKIFIDFFNEACLKIRKERPVFVRGKDGNLVKLALKKFSRQHLEMLAVWFLAKKPKMQPKIGSMLSKKMTEELDEKIRKPVFWKDLDSIFEKYYSRQYDSATRK